MSIHSNRLYNKDLAPTTPEQRTWGTYNFAAPLYHRLLAAFERGDLETARQAVTTLAEIEASLKGQKGFDRATQVEVQHRAAAGWLART